MSEPLILVTQSGAVQTLALNRPAALNSFTADLHAQLLAALEAAAQAPDVRCIVITGAGRAFCAGQDLSDPAVAPDLTPGAAPEERIVSLSRHPSHDSGLTRWNFVHISCQPFVTRTLPRKSTIANTNPVRSWKSSSRD